MFSLTNFGWKQCKILWHTKFSGLTINTSSPDLLPVGGGEFLREGADGALQLQDTGVSLGQRAPQALELLRQTPQFSLRLPQLGLAERSGRHRRDSGDKDARDERPSWCRERRVSYLQILPLFLLFLPQSSGLPRPFLHPEHRISVTNRRH